MMHHLAQAVIQCIEKHAHCGQEFVSMFGAMGHQKREIYWTNTVLCDPIRAVIQTRTQHKPDLDSTIKLMFSKSYPLSKCKSRSS